jgi:amino acid transporter
MAAFGAVMFYVLNAVGLLWWRRREPERGGPVQRRARWIPVAFFAGMLWLLVTLIVRGSVEILAALALMGAGLPVFVYMRHRRVLSVL